MHARARVSRRANDSLTEANGKVSTADAMQQICRMVKQGDIAPDFDLEADDGTRVSLESLRGRNAVLFFYPKDDTPGCTREACGFRDELPRFESMNAEVFGVNPGNAKSHRKFRAKYNLPYRLLVDEDHRLADEFGIWKEKSMFGVNYMGIERTTVVIDAKGRIARIFPKVKVDGHVDEVADAVRKLG
jgi:peroxiredoxin Q/BCP